MAALLAVVALALAGGSARASSADKLPPIPDCFKTGSGYGSCDGIAIPGGSAIVQMTAENKKTSFYLTGPTPLQWTKSVACGDLGCVYHHLDWVLGPGASAVLGCKTNQSTCDVKVAPGSGWVPVYVRQDNDYATLYAIYNTGKKGGATIYGYVTDKDGNGVSGVAVDAYGEGKSHGESGQAVSGDQGYYAMEVKPGRYKVIPSGGLGGKKPPKYEPEDAEVSVEAEGRAKASFVLQGGLDVQLTLTKGSVAADGSTVVDGEVITTQYGKPKGGVSFDLVPKSGGTPTAAVTHGALATLCDAASGGRIWPAGSLAQPNGASVKETTDSKTGRYKFSITVGTTPGPFSVEAIAVDASGVPLTKDISEVSDEVTLNLAAPGRLGVGGFLSSLAGVARSGSQTAVLGTIANDPTTMASALARLSGAGGPFGGLAYSVVNGSAGGGALLVYDSSSPPLTSQSGQVVGSKDTLVLSPGEWAGSLAPSIIQGTQLADFVKSGKLQDAPTFGEWTSGHRAADARDWTLAPATASLVSQSFEYLGWPYPVTTPGQGACN
jgi:hypothetical protein